MDFRIITDNNSYNNKWTNILKMIPPNLQDIHYLPEYGRIYNQTYGQKPFLAYYGDENEFVMQAFVKRKLNDLPFMKENKIEEDFYDIANPYGYGGPVINSISKDRELKIFKEYNHYFTKYCVDEKIASEFCSLHPLLETQNIILKSGIIPLKEEKKIVFIDLKLTEEQIFTEISRGYRSGINKARKSEVKIVKAEPTKENFELFASLYYDTMKRKKAAERWFFPEDYFFNCLINLGGENVSLFFAIYKSEVVSAYLLIHYGNIAYYHFGASKEDYFYLRANNLMMYETALWAKRNGFIKYHLGGGVTSFEEDNLFRFKSSFSSERRLLYSYSRIHNSEVYNYLISLKKDYEIKYNRAEIDSSFFPLYRR